MRVAVISREHPDHFGGGLSIAAINTARAARDAGVDVTYITAQRPDGFCNVEVRDGIRIIWMAGTTNTDYPLFLSTVLGAFPTYHKQLGFDLVHGHGYSAASLAKAGVDMPIIFHDHGSKEGYVQTVLSDGLIRGVGEACLPQTLEFIKDVYFQTPVPAGECDFKHMRRYDKVLATSSISLWDFRTRYFLTNAVLFRHCIYDLDPPPAHRPSYPAVVAVFAGSLDSVWKVGEHSLARLLPMKDDITLKMIGLGPALYAWAKGRFPRVEYTGHLPENQAMRELSSVDVLFEPSTHHLGLNLTGISALGLGVPIVAYTTGGHWDMVGEDRDAGVIVDPMRGDVCAAVREVLRDRVAFSERARARFQSMFSPEVCSKNIRAIYAEVLA